MKRGCQFSCLIFAKKLRQIYKTNTHALHKHRVGDIYMSHESVFQIARMMTSESNALSSVQEQFLALFHSLPSDTSRR